MGPAKIPYPQAPPNVIDNSRDAFAAGLAIGFMATVFAFVAVAIVAILFF